MFQSLFLWIFLCNSPSAVNQTTYGDSFNPCFYGYSYATKRNAKILRCKRVSFNPCFYGYSYATTKLTHGDTISMWGFNPYFYGYIYATEITWIDRKKNFAWFQSLFLWIFLCNSEFSLCLFRETSVSILVFIDIPMLPLLLYNIKR